MFFRGFYHNSGILTKGNKDIYCTQGHTKYPILSPNLWPRHTWRWKQWPSLRMSVKVLWIFKDLPRTAKGTQVCGCKRAQRSFQMNVSTNLRGHLLYKYHSVLWSLNIQPKQREEKTHCRVSSDGRWDSFPR